MPPPMKHLPPEFEELAKRIAHEVTREMFVKFGADPDDPVELQKDFAFMRSFREMYGDTARHGIRAVIVGALMAVAAMVWSSIKTGKTP
jgi:hypothetical protein